MTDNRRIYGLSPSRRPKSEPLQDQAWAQLAVQYLRDLPQQLDKIKTTVKAEDYSAIKEQAHRIKGTSGTYHLDAISRTAALLERLADSQNTDAIITIIDKVMRLVELETKKLNAKLVPSTSNSEGKANG
ncbi:MAG: Hpt domain-containing protein [Planctomycetota bacterium]|jgi:HPt (histidine-containing phosphotransfer) domain-containing protein